MFYIPAAAFGGSLTSALAAAAAVCAAASSGTYEEIDGGVPGDHVLKPSEIMKGRRRRNVEAATEAAYDEAGGKKAVPGGAKPTLPFILPKFPTRPDSTGSSKGQFCFQFFHLWLGLMWIGPFPRKKGGKDLLLFLRKDPCLCYPIPFPSHLVNLLRGWRAGVYNKLGSKVHRI